MRPSRCLKGICFAVSCLCEPKGMTSLTGTIYPVVQAEGHNKNTQVVSLTHSLIPGMLAVYQSFSPHVIP